MMLSTLCGFFFTISPSPLLSLLEWCQVLLFPTTSKPQPINNPSEGQSVCHPYELTPGQLKRERREQGQRKPPIATEIGISLGTRGTITRHCWRQTRVKPWRFTPFREIWSTTYQPSNSSISCHMASTIFPMSRAHV